MPEYRGVGIRAVSETRLFKRVFRSECSRPNLMSTERNEIQYASRAFQHDLVPTGRKGIMPSCREKEKIKLDVKCK